MLVAAALIALAVPLSFPVEPREASYGAEGVFRVDSRTPVVLPDNAPEQLRAHVSVLFDAAGFRMPVGESAAHDGGSRGIYIGPYEEHASLRHRRLRQAMRNQAPPVAGAYNIVIDSNRVIVTGGDLAGTFYGIITLGRMLEASPALPRVDIKDYPALAVRGVSMEGRLTPALINRLAGARCNLVMVQSDDFRDLSGTVLAHWQGLFDGARQHHVEPVPVLPDSSVEALTGVVRGLRPLHVHLGDAWARDAAGYRERIEELVRAAERLDPDLRLLAWADPIDPAATGPYPQYDGVAGSLPESLVWVSRAREPSASLGWASEAGLLMLAGAQPTRASAYAATNAALLAGAPGVVVHWGAQVDEGAIESARVAFARGWNPRAYANAWSEGFNAYFGTAFWEPSFAEMLPAFIAFMNRQTLSGRSPADVERDFTAVLREIRRAMPQGETTSVFVETAFRAVLEYVRLEASYAGGRGDTVLDSLVELVELHARLNPAFPTARRDRVIEVIRGAGLFVPSTILLGTGTGPEDSGYLMPYRALPPSSGLPLLPSLAVPVYEDSADLARAELAFGGLIGPLARVDFETVGAAEVIIAASEDGSTYRTLGTVSSRERGGVRAPVLLERPSAAPFARVAAIAPSEQAVLKEVQVSAYKEPAALVALALPNAPVIDGRLADGEWPGEPGQGFVRSDRPAFAEAQTAFVVGHDRDALFVVVRAREPRMGTMLSRMTERDGRLWEEESVELLVRPGGGPPLRLIVNALGTQYDALNWNGAWRGEWEVATRLFEHEWVAEFRIPFATLGVRPSRGDRWGLNVVRNRRNVRVEQSAWQTDAVHHGAPAAYGVVAFH